MVQFTSGEKEAIRLWFEYFRVAQRSSNPLVLSDLRKSSEFYAPWEMDKSQGFEDWWKEKRSLFLDQVVVRKLKKIDDADPGTILVQVPVNKSMTETLKDLRAVLAPDFALRGTECGKGKRVRSGPYTLTPPGVEPRLGVLQGMLTCYRDISLANPGLKGHRLLVATHEFFLTRHHGRKVAMPTCLQCDLTDKVSSATAQRNLSRYLRDAQRIVANVARGEFPGRY